MLVRGAAEPDESLSATELQRRLWDRYGIIVGGHPEDGARLIQAGVYQADDTALDENRTSFGLELQDLGFARLLGDGVLKIELGGRGGN